MLRSQIAQDIAGVELADRLAARLADRDLTPAASEGVVFTLHAVKTQAAALLALGMGSARGFERELTQEGFSTARSDGRRFGPPHRRAIPQNHTPKEDRTMKTQQFQSQPDASLLEIDLLDRDEPAAIVTDASPIARAVGDDEVPTLSSPRPAGVSVHRCRFTGVVRFVAGGSRPHHPGSLALAAERAYAAASAFHGRISPDEYGAVARGLNEAA